MKLIVVSRADPVSSRIGGILVENYGFKEAGEGFYRRGEVFLKEIGEKHIYSNGLGEDLSPELIVVASSHRSEAGMKALLTHPVGNWGEDASMGGLPRTLAPTSATALYNSLQALREEASSLRLDEWSVGLEVTHHGPATRIPLIFVEAGGPPDEIPPAKVLEAVASACLKACEPRMRAPEPAIGFGGGHYAPTFTRLSLKAEYSFGHMCPKYHLPIDCEMIAQAFEKTLERPRIAVIDWKGVKGAARRALVEALEDLGIGYVRA